ncbi:hypothetical protein [Flaviaesturariibacter terrae]
MFVVILNSGSTLVQAAIQTVDHKREMRVNWATYLNARPNEYEHSEWGGIYNLKVIFTNNSDYMMNEMTASITYIKKNGETWRVVPVKVFNVPPHTTLTQPIDDVFRCTSVQVEVSGAISQEAKFTMSQGYDSGEPADPYHMR